MVTERAEVLESHVRMDGDQLVVPVIMDDLNMALTGPWAKNAAIDYAGTHPRFRGFEPGFRRFGVSRPYAVYVADRPQPAREKVTLEEYTRMATTDHMAQAAAGADAADGRYVVEVYVA